MKGQKDNHTQRKFERIPQKVNVSILPHEHSHGDHPLRETAVTENIAEEGICLFVPTRQETGTALSLSIDLEGWQVYLRTVLSLPDDGTRITPLTASGEVIWAHELPDGEGYQLGIQFTDIDEKQFTAYKKYLHIIRESVR